MNGKIDSILSSMRVHNSVFDRRFVYLNDIIEPIYHEYLIKLEKAGHELDLDVLRPRHQVENYRALTEFLVKYFEFVLKNPSQGDIVISMTQMREDIDLNPVKYFLTIKDSSTVLKIDQKEQFSMLGARIKTRAGSGTTLALEIVEPYDKI